MAVYSNPSSAAGLFFVRKLAVALGLPLESSLLQLVLTFPFNVLLAMIVVLIAGTARILTRKPTSINHSKIEVEIQSALEDGEEVSIVVRGSNSMSPMQMVEEMPRSFNSCKDGVVVLYNWFYGFAHSRLVGIADNITPRELLSIVSDSIPSQGVIPLEYLVTSFEISNYSKIKTTKEMESKCLDSVEVLKDLIEGRDSRVNGGVKELDDLSLEGITHNV